MSDPMVDAVFEAIEIVTAPLFERIKVLEARVDGLMAGTDRDATDDATPPGGGLRHFSASIRTALLGHARALAANQKFL